MFRTSIAITLLAILTCSNAQGQTSTSKAGGLKNWWHGQTTQYTQRNQRLLQRTATRSKTRTSAKRETRSRDYQAERRQAERGKIQQVAAQASHQDVYSLPAPPRPNMMTPSERVQARIVHVPGRGTVRTNQQPRPVAKRPAPAQQTVPARRATSRTPAAIRPVPTRVTRNVPARTAQNTLRPVPAHPAAMSAHSPGSYGGGSYGGGSYGGGSPMSFGQYPATGASLYPSPSPNVPYQVGGTAITNQAFYPHEMLYAHKYKALYPPYYHRVNGHWALTPFGIWSQEQWKVEGTEVEVEYRSHISPFAGFKPPFWR